MKEVSTPIDYEKIVKELYETKFPQGFKAFHNKKYIGLKSGHDHQIDFALEGNFADASFIILGECKQYRSPVSLDRVMSFAYRIMDIAAHKGILVSASGFQAGAFKIAKSAGITLVVCRNQTLHTVLARRKEVETEPVNNFLNAITVPSLELQFAALQGDDECMRMEKNLLFSKIIADEH